jgi:long-chain acyl-CoA synthetase
VGVAVGRRLDRRFAARWRSLGLPLVSAFGCTEAAGFPAMMSDDGEVGDAAPGFEISFVGGELAFRRRVPGAAEAAPWRRTGDVALRRAPGQSALCRRDEIIPLKDDRELAPSVVEALLTSHREVRDALLVPDGQDGAAAVIVPDPDLLAAWATERRIPYSTPADLARNDELVAHFAGIVSQLNAELGRDGMASWSIGLFSLCFSPFESDDFGASGQPRRRLLEARHSELLARLHERREAVPDGWIEPSAVRMTTAAPTPHQPARESAA